MINLLANSSAALPPEAGTETVLKRLSVYHDQTKPLSDFYTNQSKVSDLIYLKVDGSKTVDEVFETISAQI